MRHFYLISVTILVVLALSDSACTQGSPKTGVYVSTTPVATEFVQEEYGKAQKRWQEHNIVSYNITVEVFSSLIPPPCNSKASINVRDNKLVNVIMTETPIPLQAPDGVLIYNPECNEYDKYLPNRQFELLGKLIAGEMTENLYQVSFNAEFGYIDHLVFGIGETMREATFSNFEPK
jgi:hypothetical protein